MSETAIRSMNFRQFLGITLSTVFPILSFSAFVPIQVVALDRLQLTAFQNGLVTSIFFIVVLATGAFVHKVVARFGHRPLYHLAKLLFSISFLIVLIENSVPMWALSSFIMGLGGALIWPITEACIAELAPEENKGRYTGIYQTILGGAFAVGPILAAILDGDIAVLMVLCGTLSLISSLFVLRFPWHLLSTVEDFTKSNNSISPQIKLLLPVLVICSFIGGFYENGLNGVSVLIGKAVGFHDTYAILIPGILGVGSFLAQYPVGVWADRYNANRVLVISLVLLIFSTMLMPLCFTEKQLMWALSLAWGGISGAMYTLSLIIIARQVEKQYVVQMTGIMVAAYTVGCAVSPSVGGFFFDISHKWGLPLSFSAILGIALLLTITFIRKFNRLSSAQSEILSSPTFSRRSPPSFSPDINCHWLPPSPKTAEALEHDHAVDIAIIGGGYAGLSSALHLKQTAPNLRVALIEANHTGFGASGRNAGWLSAFPPLYWLIDNLANPTLRNDILFATDFGNRAIASLGNDFTSPEKALSWEPTRHHLLARNPLEHTVIRWLAKRIELCGIPCEVKEDRQRTIANYPYIASLSWATTAVNPYAIISHLTQACRTAGVELYENTPIAAIRTTPQAMIAETANGTKLTAEKIILCTNAYSSHIKLDSKLPHAAARHTYMIATEPLDAGMIESINATKTPFGDPSLFYYCGRFHGNRLLFNGGDRASKATGADDQQPAIYRNLHRQLLRRFPQLSSTRIESAWGGPFMETSTETPIIKAAADNPNLIFNIGYGGGSGIGAALQSGRLMTDLVLGNKSQDTDATRLRHFFNSRRFPPLGPARAIFGVLQTMLSRKI